MLVRHCCIRSAVIAQPSHPPHLPPHSPHPSHSAYVPERVYDTRPATFVDFEVMLAAVAKADVIFVGEQHDDPNTHRLEAAILEGCIAASRAPVVSLEMFERDVQAALDAYLAGSTR